jgi:hypothetical protein
VFGWFARAGLLVVLNDGGRLDVAGFGRGGGVGADAGGGRGGSRRWWWPWAAGTRLGCWARHNRTVRAAGGVVIAEVVRDEMVESVHHGSVVITAPDGRVAWAAGAAEELMLPRSAIKPVQGLAMRHGLPLEERLLALAVASHVGEEFHVDGVREILSVEYAATTPHSGIRPQTRDIG